MENFHIIIYLFENIIVYFNIVTLNCYYVSTHLFFIMQRPSHHVTPCSTQKIWLTILYILILRLGIWNNKFWFSGYNSIATEALRGTRERNWFKGAHFVLIFNANVKVNKMRVNKRGKLILNYFVDLNNKTFH